MIIIDVMVAYATVGFLFAAVSLSKPVIRLMRLNVGTQPVPAHRKDEWPTHPDLWDVCSQAVWMWPVTAWRLSRSFTYWTDIWMTAEQAAQERAAAAERIQALSAPHDAASISQGKS